MKTKFALVNGEREEPQKGLQGVCEICQSVLIAKCGDERIKHWAHKSKIPCDPWWENETEWHKKWKNLFPRDWQEKIHTNSSTGEKHIADVKTDKELVIEFQYSAIKSDEIKSREAFYKNMVWVVDGTRLKKDYPRFCAGMNGKKPFFKGFFLSPFPGECFPTSWLASSAPVYFDFQGDSPDVQHPALWCLFPAVEGHAVIAGVPREQFIEFSKTAPHLLFARELLNVIPEYLQSQRQRTVAANLNMAPRSYTRKQFRL